MYGIQEPVCPNIMKKLKIPGSLVKDCLRHLLMVFLILNSLASSGQNSPDWVLDKMPVDLEKDFALSALPPHLRDQATVYLLDPKKGYYIARRGTNGFSAFVNRTEWEHAEFVQDTYAAISYDSEGTQTYLPVFLAVAELRASGKYSPEQIRDIIIKRIKDGTYKAPSRTGVSYMLSPLLRTHPGPNQKEVINMVMPHYMLYAPRVDNADIGGVWDNHGPFALTNENILDKKYCIFNYIIIPAGDAEKAKIIEANMNLLRRLSEYKSCLKIETDLNHNH